MSDAVFPTLPGLSWGVVKTPIWKTFHQESVSGMEYDLTMMTYPRYRISMQYEVLRASTAYAELQQLIGFFNQRRGSWDSFLWQDPDDFQVADATFGTGDGATKVFALSRSFGGFVEPVVDLFDATVIKVSGVIKASPGDYSIANGKVTFVTAPSAGAPLTWTGKFYKRVRFVRDEADFEKFLADLWNAKRIELITKKNK